MLSSKLITATLTLALELTKGVSAAELAKVLTMLGEALIDNVDDRITGRLTDCIHDLDQLQDELDDASCTCPWETVRADMISPPERLTGRNRDCPIHGIDPDYERDRQIDDRLTGDA